MPAARSSRSTSPRASPVPTSPPARRGASWSTRAPTRTGSTSTTVGSACGGMGMTVLGASKAAAAGGDGRRGPRGGAEQAREQLRMWFAIDTLEYLRRGGRIGAARAWVGSALQIKPILTLEEEITPVERVRTRRRVFERLVAVRARAARRAVATAGSSSTSRTPRTRSASPARPREIFGSDPVFISEVGPVIGAHTGSRAARHRRRAALAPLLTRRLPGARARGSAAASCPAHGRCERG